MTFGDRFSAAEDHSGATACTAVFVDHRTFPFVFVWPFGNENGEQRFRRPTCDAVAASMRADRPSHSPGRCRLRKPPSLSMTTYRRGEQPVERALSEDRA